MKNKLFLLSFVFIFTTFFSNTINAKPINLTEDQKGIIGTWQIKRNVSANSKGELIPVAFTPETLILAGETDLQEITINEGFKEFIQTQTLPTDGTAVAKNIYKIGKVSSKAVWKGKSLVINLVTEKGDKIAESFELSPNGKQLFVTVQFEKHSSAKVLKVRRVFNRVAEVKEDNVAQVGITIYPL